MSSSVFGVPPAALVDRILPLEDFWGRETVDRLMASLQSADLPQCLAVLQDHVLGRMRRDNGAGSAWHEALRMIQLHAGRLSIRELANTYGLSRQQFAREFSAATGMTPKLFARMTRFQTLVHTLLSTDVSQWVGVSSDVGFYDQAHMINEFRFFAGSPPTVFFRPHGGNVDPTAVLVRGRPSDWLVNRDRERERAAGR